MDTLGFNTGGRISPNKAHLRVDSTGNPHIAYVRDSQVWYATKSGTTWSRERVDGATYPAYSPESSSIAIALNATNRPSVTYEYYQGYERLIFATRTAANTWSNTLLVWPLGTNYASRARGDLLFDSAGTAFMLLEIYAANTNSTFIDYLGSWTGTTAEVRQMTVSGTTAPGRDAAHAR